MNAETPLFTTITSEYRHPALSGYVQMAGPVDKAEAEAIAAAWRDAVENDKLIVLPGDARFVPWSAFEPQAVLSEPLESKWPETVKWLAVGTFANALTLIVIVLTLVVR